MHFQRPGFPRCVGKDILVFSTTAESKVPIMMNTAQHKSPVYDKVCETTGVTTLTRSMNEVAILNQSGDSRADDRLCLMEPSTKPERP
jgi:hypothetical protein